MWNWDEKAKKMIYMVENWLELFKWANQAWLPTFLYKLDFGGFMALKSRLLEIRFKKWVNLI